MVCRKQAAAGSGRPTLKGVLLRSAPGEGVKLQVRNWRAEPANTPLVEQARPYDRLEKNGRSPDDREKEPLKPLQKYSAYVSIFL